MEVLIANVRLHYGLSIQVIRKPLGVCATTMTAMMTIFNAVLTWRCVIEQFDIVAIMRMLGLNVLRVNLMIYLWASHS